MVPNNKAIWLSAKKSSILEVKPASYPSAKELEIVVQSHAIALILADYSMQDAGTLSVSWAKYPFTAGIDVAGIVTDIGSKGTQFKDDVTVAGGKEQRRDGEVHL